MLPIGFVVCLIILVFPSLVANHVCNVEEIANGRWISTNVTHQKVYKSFFCCGWDKKNFQYPDIAPYCARTRQREEFWKGSIPFLEHHFMQTGGHGCNCDSEQNTRFNVSERERWFWEPSQCSLLNWNATHFCSLLSHRRVLLIGDSTMAQTATTVMNMVYGDFQKKYSSSPESFLELSQLMKACNARIEYRRINAIGYNNSEASLFMWIKEHDYPDIVIIGVGPHYHSVEHFEKNFQEFLSELAHFRADLINRRKPPIQFIWKAINSPHFHCHTYSSPAETPPLLNIKEDFYQWTLFPKYDEIARNLTKQHDIDFIDMHPLKLRPDAHPGYTAWDWGKAGGDCLHFCIPGPLNLFSNMLMSYLHYHPPVPSPIAKKFQITAQDE